MKQICGILINNKLYKNYELYFYNNKGGKNNKMLFSNKKIANFVANILIISLGVLFVNCSETYAGRELGETTLDTAKRSENIVLARCISSESKWNDEGSFIFTYVTFQIEDTIKGEDAEDEITLRLIGGQVGDQILSAPDIPNINEDEEVILFLGPKNNDGYPTITSLKNGVLRIQSDGVTGKRMVTTPTSGIKIYKENTEKNIRALRGKGILLEDFVHSLKRTMNK